MLSGINVTSTIMRIASFNQQNKAFLADSLMKIASGKAVNKPEDSTGDFFKAQNINTESRGYRVVQQQVGEAIAMNEVAVEAGSQVFGLLNDMMQLVDLYWDESDPDAQQAYKSDFSSRASQITSIIANTRYDDKQLISDTSGDPLTSIYINPHNQAQTYDISFDNGDVVDSASLETLDIGAPDKATVKSTVQAELDKAASYLAKTSAYSRGLWAQHNMIEKKLATNAGHEQAITGVNEANELTQVIKRQVAHDASLAMLAQANLMHRNVLMLCGLNRA
ncbi:MAG: hypothetical protein GF350_04140 [Chitinivibrionales bacterium]|nr:hypothetical protein [Chitinivibrionales bacterium]